ncbi:MAG: outer membrane protein assembly factor BamD [Phycisphaerae bacterium]|jgi:outer membrane assembly lipoprotein YfiO
MMNGYRFALLAAAMIVLCSGGVFAQQEFELEGGKWSPTAPPAKGTAEGELSLIRSWIDHGDDGQVEQAAKDFLKQHGDSPLREEVMLLAGEAQVNRGRFFQGYEWFEKQLSEFPDGRFSDRALDREFAVAEAFLAGKKRIAAGIFFLPAQDEGIDILGRIAEHVPGTAMAERALLRVAEYHYAKQEYGKAADAYDRYLELFAKSKQAPDAMLKAAEATFRSFGGLAYDVTPLIEAEQRFREYSERFPISAKAANVPATLAQIRNLRAGKVFSEAAFYERVGRPSAAAYYYRLVIEDYPHSDYAEQANYALEKLASRLPPKAIEAASRPAPRPSEELPIRRPQPKGLGSDEVIDLEKLAPTTQETREEK